MTNRAYSLCAMEITQIDSCEDMGDANFVSNLGIDSKSYRFRDLIKKWWEEKKTFSILLDIFAIILVCHWSKTHIVDTGHSRLEFHGWQYIYECKYNQIFSDSLKPVGMKAIPKIFMSSEFSNNTKWLCRCMR